VQIPQKNIPDFSPISSINRRQILVVWERCGYWTEVRRVLFEFFSLSPGLKPGATEEGEDLSVRPAKAVLNTGEAEARGN
jgi:hypothetical protein